MSVLTAGEGAGLDSMFEGIQRRYSDANVNLPEVVYVDRDCCGSNFIGKKFQSWSATQVRLDIWHFMRRISSACTTESHALYPQFMRRLSGCIFYWSEEDLAALKLAKETQAMKEGMTVQGKEQEWLTKKELALHCRRTTRSPVEIRQQINELLEVFSGEQGRDMLGTPLLDADKARDVWESQQRHVDCIQDPPNVSLYTQTGTLKKGTKTLPTYRCARGSTYLESFHLHLNRFIPCTSANDVHYQAFLLEGLYRWNQDRASQAVEVEAPLCHTYSGLLRHAVNQLSQTVLGNPLDPAFQHPRAYTGELIGVEYLYSQTGKVLQAIPEELAEEDQPTEEDQDHDEGFEEEDAEDDPTVPDANFEVAAVRPTGKPAASAVGPEASTARPPSSPRAVWQRGSPRSPAHAVRSPRTPTPSVTPDSWTPTKDQPTQRPEGGVSVPLEEENSDEDQLPEPTSGMQPVHDLADYLLQLRDCRTLTRTQQEQLAVLWDKLEPQDQRPVVFKPRARSSPKGRFMASKTGKSPVKANVEKTKRSFVGTGTGPASYPDANRYMEALVKRLTELYPSAIRRPGTPTITRWSLIQAAYNRIREVVMEDPRVSDLTGIQLLPLNQATLILWDRRRQARQEEVVLSQGIEISDPPVTAPQPLPPPLSKPATLLTSSAPAHRYQLPPNTAGQSHVRIRSPHRMPSPQMMPSPPRIIRHPVIAPGPVQYRYVLTQVPPNQTPQPAIPQYQEPEFTAQALSPLVSGSTACYRRKVEKRKRMGEYVRQYKPRRGPSQCSQCKKPKVAPSHRQYFGNWYCEETTGESYEDWAERMCLRGYTSRKRRQPPPDEEDPTADPP
nr:uncharacterized protein LOC105331633 [Crassostrea gigas]